jgi:hypothetical protein
MAITQVLCTSFKKELLEGTHDFSSQNFKIALYTSAATLNADTTVYSTDNEVSGAGYTAGGYALTRINPSSGDGVGFTGFEDATWASSSFTARGALIYNTTGDNNRAVMVLDFGDDKTSNNSTFTVGMPANTSTAALIRIT